ncbi:hypothetical protein [Chitinophaga sp. CF418]|uniref:hypothetical protein n=1 Tax=Chitinophaga sp. CF418 TaxID=1855287 RepID=UPI0009166C37|nr:hypothetical protein [Chitinophaga sp. CF418]SHN40517.1 hypothetical protein SAMN05216311_11240 [Chitinophaga sp. CF418]
MHTYSNSSPQQKAAAGQPAQLQNESDTSFTHASVNSNATILQQLADNSEQVRKAAQLKAIADRRAFPVQRQAVTAGKVVQLMPFSMLQTGKWYKVLVDGEPRILYLKSRRGAFDGKPASCLFGEKERGGDTITIGNEDDILALSGPPPEPEPIEEELQPEKNDAPQEDKPKMETVYFSSHAKASQLGVVSWNVNHFSNKDFGNMLSALRKEFANFSQDEWDLAFEVLDMILKDVREEKYLKLYKQDEKGFKRKYENKPAFKDKFKRLQNKPESIASISNLVDRFFSLGFDHKAFSAKLQSLIDIDWEGKYKLALQSTVERPAFTLLVKRLVDFADDVKSVGRVTSIIQQLKDNHNTFLTKFDKMDTNTVAGLFDALGIINASLMTIGSLEDMLSALHTQNIQKHVDEMFQRNSDWLDVVALHEVNDPSKLKESVEYDMHVGPHLMSAQGKGQNEYYPLLIRKGAHVTVKQIYLVTTDGRLQPTENGKQEKWNKNFAKQEDKIFRPIVVYELEKMGNKGKKQIYWLGIVHTTPESDTGISEFNREKIYDEVEEGLKTLRGEADKRRIPLVIGGDYYLTAEAVTRDMSEKEKKDFNEDDWELEDYSETYASIEKLELELNERLSELLDKLQELKEGEEEDEANKAEREYLGERLKFLAEAKRDNQILRNIYGLTVAARVEDLGLYLTQPVTGTNPKKKPLLRWFDLQIADFFIHGQGIKSAQAGILRPQGQIAKVDTEDMYNSRYWQHFSDHFPVGGIFSTKNKDLSAHRALAGVNTAKAKELANISNRRRFARLQLIEMEEKPDLTLKDLGDEEIDKLALSYLHGYLKLNYLVEDKPPTIADCIGLIQMLDDINGAEDDERLFVTLPGDFEPDTAAMAAVPVPMPGKTGKSSREKADKNQRFLLNQQQELQQGWNCGDLAIGLSRDELVQWLLTHEDDDVVRELLAPEIRTAAATSLMNENAEAVESREKEEKLKTLFTLLDEAKEEEIREVALMEIHSALKNEKSSGGSANRTGLPEGMLTEELKGLLNEYYNAHEEMKDIVLLVNNVLGFSGGNLKDAMQLDTFIENNPDNNNVMVLKDEEIYEGFAEELNKLKDADKELNKYLTRKDVFRKYVQNYYGNQGWMVYHLDFKGDGEDVHTSVIDLAAKFKQTMVQIWVLQQGGFKLHRSTAQYGTGVVNVLYNGYNHFIGLNDNLNFVGEAEEQPAPQKEDVMEQEIQVD